MRINRHQMFMEIAHTVAKRSTCFRGNVGAVLTYNSRVVSIGYNGAPAGEEHCTGNECPLSEDRRCKRAVHAERNCIDHCKLNQEELKQASIYVTTAPCRGCATVMGYRIGQLFYEGLYSSTSGIHILLDKGIKVFRTTPSGFIIDELNNRVLEG